MTDEWIQEKQRHARTKQSFQMVAEQHNKNAVARLQPARIATQPLSPLPSPASAPSHAVHSAPHGVAASHYPTHSLPPPASTTSPFAGGGTGWGSSSHGSLEYGKDGNIRAAHNPAAVATPYQSQHPSANMMPAHMDSSPHNVDSRRRQLPLYTPLQPSRPSMPVTTTEQQRYQWERQAHNSGASGLGGSRQPQHTQAQHKSKKRGYSHAVRTHISSPTPCRLHSLISCLLC